MAEDPAGGMESLQISCMRERHPPGRESTEKIHYLCANLFLQFCVLKYRKNGNIFDRIDI